MSRLRYLLDEHVAHAIQSQLLRLDADIDVLAVGQPGAPAQGTDDSNILAWIEQTGYVFITGNRRTIPEHLQAHYQAGRSVPGIFFLRRQADLGQIIEQLYLLWVASESEEYENRLLYLPM
jgi:hypothetical protein